MKTLLSTISIIVLAVISSVLTSCSSSSSPSSSLPPSGAPFEILFKTDYESMETFGNALDTNLDLIKVKNLIALNDSFIPDPLYMGISYEGGSYADRFVKITEDPAQAGNHVLYYWMKNATIYNANIGSIDHYLGRIMTSVDFSQLNLPLETMYFKQRMYFHPDLALLLDYPITTDASTNWWVSMTLGELWVGDKGADETGDTCTNCINRQVRITFALHPDPVTGKYYFSASAQRLRDIGTNTLLWGELNSAYQVPLGKWITIETGYQMGDNNTGRFIVIAQTDNDPDPVVIFNIKDWTYDSESPIPIKLALFNPQKLYTSDNVLHYIRDKGGVAQIYWDDFEFASTLPDVYPFNE